MQILSAYGPQDISDAYNMKLNSLASMTAHAETMKVIEQKYLPMIVNQFGGISSGYIHNHPDSNPIVKATMERFSKFVEEQDVDIKTAKNTTLTDMLYLFLSEDETISTDYKKIYEKELSKLSLNQAGNLNVYSDGLALNTVNDLYNENVQKVLTKNQVLF